MKKYSVLIILCSFMSIVFSQSNTALDKNITLQNTQRIIGVLASDDMKGRKVFSAEIDNAAAFIANEFKTIGLEPLNKNGGYLQKFTMLSAQQTSVSAT